MFKGWALESSFFGKRCALGYSYFGKWWGREYPETLTVTGIELDIQESGVTASSDREGGQGKVGWENSETSTVMGIRARHARNGHHSCF